MIEPTQAVLCSKYSARYHSSLTCSSIRRRGPKVLWVTTPLRASGYHKKEACARCSTPGGYEPTHEPERWELRSE